MTEEGVERTLGRLSAQMDSIAKNLDRAEEKRSEIYQRIEEQNRKMEEQNRLIAQLEADMLFVKPVAEEVRRMKLMGLGALDIVGLGSGLLAVTFSDFISWIGRLLK